MGRGSAAPGGELIGGGLVYIDSNFFQIQNSALHMIGQGPPPTPFGNPARGRCWWSLWPRSPAARKTPARQPRSSCWPKNAQALIFWRLGVLNLGRAAPKTPCHTPHSPLYTARPGLISESSGLLCIGMASPSSDQVPFAKET